MIKAHKTSRAWLDVNDSATVVEAKENFQTFLG